MPERTEMFDEQAILLRCQQGDRQAFGLLVERYMKRAYYIALGITASHEDALDLSQEAFVRAFRAIKRIDVTRRFFTWYYKILRNLCLNFVRDRTRHARSFSDVGEYRISAVTDGDDPSAVYEREERKRVFWKAMDLLKPNEREIITMKDFQELSYQEIAGILDCPVGTVMSRLYHARQALKTRLEELLQESRHEEN